jgi:uncharacterized protein (UPF0276 family)
LSSPASRLGVGLSYQGPLRGFVREHLEAFDFLEIVPDIFWTEHPGVDGPRRFEENRDAVRFLDWVAERRPLVAHSVGMSIGSAGHFDTHYVAQLARWRERYHFPWLSEHLSFNRLPYQDAGVIDVGVTLPVPYDEDVLELLAERVALVQDAFRVPFLLENNVYYFQYPEQELGESRFLGELTRRTGCGLLLDLHNVYTNARNHGFEPRDFLASLDLSRVVEVHLAGGLEWEGFYLDAHSGACPEPVWALLEELLPRLPRLRGVVYELFGNYFPQVGPETVRGELQRLRDVLARHPG